MPSTVIASMHYDAAQHALTVIFVSGNVYKYMNVPQKVYEAMKTSGSKGTYLNNHIKGSYPFEKIS